MDRSRTPICQPGALALKPFCASYSSTSARPRRDDWSQMLDDVERAFHQWQTWA
jgi:hypothetical protein